MAVQEQKQTYPRFTREFIGIGHELQRKKQDRRKIALQERIRLNRVLFLEKEEIKAERTLMRKKEQVHKVVSTADRLEEEAFAKEQLKKFRLQQIQRLRQENKVRRISHREAKQMNYQTIQARKSHDYSLGKKARERAEIQRRSNLLEDIQSKRSKANSVLESHQKGRDKIDKYFKKINKKHAEHYNNMIERQEKTTLQKIHTIKELEQMQTALTQKLYQKTQKVSQVELLLLNVSRSISRERCSRVSLNHSFGSKSQLLHGQLSKKNTNETNLVEESIQPQQTAEQQNGNKKEEVQLLVRKRKRNRHKNRYRQYQQF